MNKTDSELHPKPVWLVRAGRYGEDEATALEENLSIIGWRKVSDLSDVKDRSEIEAAVKTAHPDASEATKRNYVGQLAGSPPQSQPSLSLAITVSVPRSLRPLATQRVFCICPGRRTKAR